MAEGGNSKQFVYKTEIRGFSVFMGSEKDTGALPFMFTVVETVNAYFVVRSQEESTDIGKNMYANWNMLQKNTLVCAFWSMCGKKGEYRK